ncbi:hypothetical protein ACQP3J_30685, partial [Escherichia coli]
VTVLPIFKGQNGEMNKIEIPSLYALVKQVGFICPVLYFVCRFCIPVSLSENCEVGGVLTTLWICLLL